MGVKGLFSTLRNTYPAAFKTQKPQLDHVYLDANALLYPIAEDTKVSTSIARIVLETCNAYGVAFNTLASMFFDGPPPMGKVRQQRLRRFQYEPATILTTTTAEVGQRQGIVDIVASDTNLQQWSPAMFSTGTTMMAEIDTYINAHISEYRSIGDYSSYHDPGEGEHKIIRAIRAQARILQRPNSRGQVPQGQRRLRMGIVGKDADLILLSMGLSELMGNVDIFILRHDDTQMLNGYRHDHPMYYIDTTMLRTQILANMRLRSIWEFVIATFLVGNDFLPPIPGVDNIYDYIPLLTRITQTQTLTLHNGANIEWGNMLILINLLISRTTPNPNWVQTAASSENREGRRESNPSTSSPSHEVFETLYYPNMSPFPVDTQRLTRAWMITVQWVFSYYYEGMDAISQSWQYMTYFAPTLMTLSSHMGDVGTETGTIARERNAPLTPLQALGAVLPSWLWDLIPDRDTRRRVRDARQYYPYSFEKLRPTEEPIIPAIPYDVAKTF